jgi:pimeloyl-ACP methyl ester carboxylesterase
MRAHGRTICRGNSKSYDAETIGDDFGAVADHLGIDQFHLLTHATGGMAGIDYAIRHQDRLLSLMSTDTGSATWPSLEAETVHYPNQTYERKDPIAHPMLAVMIEDQKAKDPNERLVLPRVPMEDHVIVL